MDIKFKKLDERAVTPAYAHSTDACFDLTVIDYTRTGDKLDLITYNTGLAMEIPEGHVGLIFPRSSIYKYDLTLSNCVGVIDSGYRGEIKAVFRETNTEYGSSIYQIGERALQMMIIPIPKINLVQVDELDSSDRGEGGFGSSGRK